MTTASVSDQLRVALEHLAKGDQKSMSEALMAKPFRDAMAELKSDHAEAFKLADQIVHQLGHTAQPGLAEHLKPVAADVLKALGTGEFEPALQSLNAGLARVDVVRQAQAAAFSAGEAAHYGKVGPLRYAIDLIKRRWSGDGNILPSEAVEHAGHSHAEHHHAEPHVHGPACEHGHHHHEPHAAPKALAEAELKNANALEEFGEVKLLKNGGQKLAVAAGSAVGLGLVVHGASNAISAFSQPHNPELELDAHSAEQHSGTNLTQLCVGIAEAAVGAALTYRLLAGRAALRKPVEGKVASLFEGCSHGHGIPHIGA